MNINNSLFTLDSSAYQHERIFLDEILFQVSRKLLSKLKNVFWSSFFFTKYIPKYLDIWREETTLPDYSNDAFYANGTQLLYYSTVKYFQQIHENFEKKWIKLDWKIFFQFCTWVFQILKKCTFLSLCESQLSWIRIYKKKLNHFFSCVWNFMYSYSIDDIYKIIFTFESSFW